MKFSFFFVLCMGFAILVKGQQFSFAHVTDTHVGGSTGAEDLALTVKDINANSSLSLC